MIAHVRCRMDRNGQFPCLVYGVVVSKQIVLLALTLTCYLSTKNKYLLYHLLGVVAEAVVEGEDAVKSNN